MPIGIEDITSGILSQIKEIPAQIQDTASAGLGMAMDIELSVREAKDIDGNNKIRKLLFRMLAPDELKESAGLKQGEEIRSEIAMSQRRIEGLKAELPPEDHVFLNTAAELYQILHAKNEASKKALTEIREVVSALYSVNDSMATDKGIQLIGTILQTLLVDTLSSSATFGISLGAKVFIKSLLFGGKKLAEYKNEQQEEKSLQQGKEIKHELSKLDKFMVELIAHTGIEEEHSDLIKNLFNSVEDIEDHLATHKYIFDSTNVNVHELLGTKDLVQNLRMIKAYEKNPPDIADIVKQSELINDQIARLSLAKNSLKAKQSTATGTSPEEIKAMKIEKLLDSKIKLLQKESSILEKIILKLESSPTAGSRVLVDDGSRQQFNKDQAKKPHASSSENKESKILPSPKYESRDEKLANAKKDFMKSPQYIEYKNKETKLIFEGKNIIKNMEALKSSPAKAAKILDQHLKNIVALDGDIRKAFYGSTEKGFKQTAKYAAYSEILKNLEKIHDQAVELRTGTSPQVFATTVPTGSDSKTIIHTTAPTGTPAKAPDSVNKSGRPSTALHSGLFSTSNPKPKPATRQQEKEVVFHTPTFSGRI